MRIGLLTHTTAGRGGIERVVELQAEGLRARGHVVDVFSGSDPSGGWFGRAFSSISLGLRRSGDLRDYDVLLAHYQPAPWLATRSGVPFVHYFHHPLRAVHPTEIQLRQLRFRVWRQLARPLRRLDERTVRQAYAVAVPSPSVGRDLALFYGLNPVLLAPGVDTQAFTPGGGRAEHLLFVGRPSEPYKRLNWAIEVARRVGRPLHVVGEGQHADEPGVRWLGYLRGRELIDAYRSAALLVFPSVREDFGLVPLEAMATGLPVVGWDDSHGPSVTLATGSGGRLAPAYDLDAFSQIVIEILTAPELHRELSASGPSWVRDHFSLDHHVAELERLLIQAADK